MRTVVELIAVDVSKSINPLAGSLQFKKGCEFVCVVKGKTGWGGGGDGVSKEESRNGKQKL